MNIALSEIDPTIASRYGTAATARQPSTYADRQARSWRVQGLLALSVLVPPVLGLGMASALFEMIHNNQASIALWMTVWWGGTGAGCMTALKSSRKSRRVSHLALEDMQKVFPQLSLTRSERLYCDILQFLVRSETTSENETYLRDTLAQINELVGNSRQLENRRLSLLPLMGINVHAELQTEYTTLERRLHASTDAITRASLEQSLQMIHSRMENSRNIELGVERLLVQQEAISQTLASTLSSLARMQLAAHLPQTEYVMQDISQTVMHMNQQTYAVEKAVEEVITLRPSY